MSQASRHLMMLIPGRNGEVGNGSSTGSVWALLVWEYQTQCREVLVGGWGQSSGCSSPMVLLLQGLGQNPHPSIELVVLALILCSLPHPAKIKPIPTALLLEPCLLHCRPPGTGFRADLPLHCLLTTGDQLCHRASSPAPWQSHREAGWLQIRTAHPALCCTKDVGGGFSIQIQ